jgi:hypothetical protein
MKHFYVAAGALLLGTSALAWAADKDVADKTPVGESIAKQTMMSLEAEKQTPIEKYADSDWSASSEADASLALASSPGTMDKSALGDPVSAKLETGDYAKWSDDASQAKLVMASAEADPSADPTQTAMSDKVDPSVTAETQAAMGGPIEEADATMTASLAPRPAAGNYPPCEPGPGDDNCIQLYEPGVRAQLASWNAPTGGLADGSVTTAMGGPYEPVADHADASATSAMALGETEDVSLAGAEPDIDAYYEGVGGPVVSQSGYPACEPGPGDDRCIQLYERGVTGAGN